MTDLQAGIRFLRAVAEQRVVIAPHPGPDGLAGAAIIWRTLRGDRQVLCPNKGEALHSADFLARLREKAPQALIVIDQGSRAEPILPGTPTLIVDHHVPIGLPQGVFVSSHTHHPRESTAQLCHQLVGTPDELLWLAAIGEIGDYGIRTSFPFTSEAIARYTQPALQETVSLLNAARRSSRFAWPTAFDVLVQAEDPREIADRELPGVQKLLGDREEVAREIERARKAHPFFADPWAIIPFSSPCLIHGPVAAMWTNRLKEHFVVSANFGYRPGYVHFSARSAAAIDLTDELLSLAPEGGIPGEWGRGQHGTVGGATTRQLFLLLLNHMGFTPQQTLEVDFAAQRAH